MRRKINIDEHTEAGLASILMERNAVARERGERPLTKNQLAALILRDVVADDAEAEPRSPGIH